MGQVGTQGSILGAVLDSSRAALPGASITVTNLDTGLVQTATAGDGGQLRDPRAADRPLLGHRDDAGLQDVAARADRAHRRRAQPRVAGPRRRATSPSRSRSRAVRRCCRPSAARCRRSCRWSRSASCRSARATRWCSSTWCRACGSPARAGPSAGPRCRASACAANQTEFQLDGLNANAAMDEGGITIPNVDTIAEFSVETSSFSAENGRNPLQVVMATKSGHQRLPRHGVGVQPERRVQRAAMPSRWRTRRSCAATSTARRSAARSSATGRSSSAASRPRRSSARDLYNSVVRAAGDAAGRLLRRVARHPGSAHRPAVPRQHHPGESHLERLEVLLPVRAARRTRRTARFRAVAPVTNDTYQYTARVDHQITPRQRIYGALVMNKNTNDAPGYSPDVRSADETTQHNIGVNYTNTLTPTMLLTATGGYLKSDNRFTSPVVGTDNLAEQAGIRGIGTAGREDFVGLPNVGITGYTGFNTAFGVNGRLWSDVKSAKVSLTWVRGAHSLSTGYEYNDRSRLSAATGRTRRAAASTSTASTPATASPTSCSGLTSGTPAQLSARDVRPRQLALFRRVRAGLLEGALQSDARPRAALRVLALQGAAGRQRRDVRSRDRQGDRRRRQRRPGEPGNQPVSPFLAAATQGLWVPANEVGVPNGLFKANGHFSPRVGLTWRPEVIKDFVVRGGYGIYYNSFTGNRSASSIVGLPYWTWEALSFSALSPQQWETAWPADPQSFIQPSVGESPDWDIDADQDARVERLGPEGAAVQLGDHRLVRRHAPAEPGLAVSVQRGAARRLPESAGGQAVPGVRRDQRAREPRHRRVQRPADQAGAAIQRRLLVHRFRTRWPRTRPTRSRRTRPGGCSRSCRPATCAGAARRTAVTCCGSTRSTGCRSGATHAS